MRALTTTHILNTIAPAAFLLLTAACSTLPPKEIYVAWSGPCTDGPTVRRVLFVDTLTPTLDCIRASSAADSAKFVLLTLVGMPVLACTVTTYYSDGSEYSTIYAPISPSPVQVAVAVGTLHPPEELLKHELTHAFGGTHFAPLPNAETCHAN